VARGSALKDDESHSSPFEINGGLVSDRAASLQCAPHAALIKTVLLDVFFLPASLLTGARVTCGSSIVSEALRIFIGLASVALLMGGQPVQAQTTIAPVYFCGVVGSTGRFLTTQGDVHTFPAGARFNRSSLEGSSLAASQEYFFGTTWNQFNNVETLWVTPRNQTFSAPRFGAATLEYRNGATPVGTGEVYVVVFATAQHRDAFLYYTAQSRAATSYVDYLYFKTLSSYEFWLGQEKESLALYYYYLGIADYLFLTTPTARQGEYNYWYYRGLGAYYYFEGLGDSQSAWLAFTYHVKLADDALAY
jgi:hypothetical protein